MYPHSKQKKTPVTLLALSIALALQAGAAAAQDAGAAATELDTVTVTGYRASVEKALDIKRGEAGMVDAVVAEDIGKFPDSNLAESLQRIPGVVITRDGGEGRQITVRGLGPDFTRVRINGMEALSTVGSSDGQGGTNRSRGFDFNVFASDLFSQLIARKTASADVEEGSLGATVDLRTARPFDYDGFTLVTNVQTAYNDASQAAMPRFAGLIANSWADGKVGALLSVAYSERETVEEGTGTVRWANARANTPTNTANPKGVGFAGCAEGTAPFPGVCSDQVYTPRFPRYTLMEHDQKRLGVTGSLQFKPSDRTTFSLDMLYSKIDAQRDEKYIEANGLSKTGADGKAQIVVRDGVIENGALVYAKMDNVDIRAENRHDEWSTDFYQVSLDGEHRLTDSFTLSGRVGTSRSKHDNPVQATIMMDKLDVQGYSYDYRGNANKPVFNYGVSPTDPNGWTLSTIRLRQNYVTNEFHNGELDFSWVIGPSFTLSGGVQGKNYSFDSMERRRVGNETAVPNFSTGNKIVPADMTELASLGGLAGSPGTWVVPNFGAIANMFGVLNGEGIYALVDYPASMRGVEEQDRSGWLMGKFSTEIGSIPVYGNLGVRHVRTKQTSSGIATASGKPVAATVTREYNDTLPSLNVVAELTPDFLLRFAAAKVMSRPGLGSLTPGVTVNVSGSARTVSGGNPMLDPVRAKSYDLGLEWYFDEGAMLGATVFYKDIGSYIQNTRETRVYADSGLPASLLDNLNASPSDEFTFTVPVNTPGGKLQGVELNYVQPFTFLPGKWSNLGTQLNYTYVDSDIQYLLSSGATAQKAAMTGQSKNSWNATLFYEGERFSGRVSATNRNDYLIQVPGTEAGFNSDANGVHGQSGTTIVDASIHYRISDQLELSLEGANLTNEAQESWVANPSVSLPLEYSQTGRTYTLGLRYRF
ncbi:MULTISPECIES: TonB-dependent receptor [Stenotrophomonas]|jgi:TonB-dependent receptor|uniref:TonB-dependent receptor n=1 Tax=Stenotrophomonas TaxID=40323 RepID=UPI00070256E5|nr:MULTISPECIES: TonB-dependent receptor [Stenotrophomonas]KRG83449.1 TonB-dependent receptor [Stenotrophomonas acidaminiphila]QOF98635.1 TonB-dependent receptor [Stenotrophomonas sp. CW117]WHL18903.1 TonB-dependent receptor [Stenotrophomonas acidaminiphila]